MTIGRRTFLKTTAGGLAASAALGLLPETVRKAMAIPAHSATGTIMDVEHVVIFMQENRSFDHYFGAFNGVRGCRWLQSPRQGYRNIFPYEAAVVHAGRQFDLGIDSYMRRYKSAVCERIQRFMSQKA
jgi:hypothetical protein